MATIGTIKHRHQSGLPPGTSDVDVPQWNDSEVMAGGTAGDACVRDITKADGWGWEVRAPLASPAFTGVPTVPTAAPGTNTTQAASCAFVTAASAPPVWVAQAYSASFFIGTGTMTWTVDAGDQVRFSYLLQGKTMTLSVYLDTTTLSGTATAELRIYLPAAKTVLAPCQGNAWIAMGGTSVPGMIRGLTGGTYLSVFRADLSNYVLGTNNVIVTSTFTFEIT